MLRIYCNEGENIIRCGEGAILYFLKETQTKNTSQRKNDNYLVVNCIHQMIIEVQ